MYALTMHRQFSKVPLDNQAKRQWSTLLFSLFYPFFHVNLCVCNSFTKNIDVMRKIRINPSDITYLLWVFNKQNGNEQAFTELPI